MLFTMTTPPEDRWTRWRKVRAQGVSPEDVAGFTGELRADVELARFQRLTSAVIGFSMAGGGIAAGVLSLASDDEDARIIGLSLGIGLTVIGLATGFLSLAIRSPIEDDWSEMRRGNVPIEEAATGIELHVAPAIAKDGGGLGLTGTF